MVTSSKIDEYDLIQKPLRGLILFSCESMSFIVFRHSPVSDRYSAPGIFHPRQPGGVIMQWPSSRISVKLLLRLTI